MKNVSRLVFGNLLVLSFFLLLLEVLFRLVGEEPYRKGDQADIEVLPSGQYFQPDTILGYRHICGASQVTLKKEYRFTTTHDSSTLRITSSPVDSVIVPRPEIWLMGCSFTYGWAINDEETFAWRLQEKLPSYELVNWGVNGYGTIHFYLQLKEALKSGRHPAIVMVNHADFHVERNTFSFGRRRRVARWNFLGQLNQPYATLSVRSTLQMKYSVGDYTPWVMSTFSALIYNCEIAYETYQDQQKEAEGLIITEKLLDRIVGLCVENDVQLVLVNIDGQFTFLRDYCQRRNLPAVDISVDRSKRKYNNQPYDGHPSALANLVYASKVYTFLTDHVTLK